MSRTRREIIKSAGIAAVAGATAGTGGSAQARTDAGSRHWDHSADVVCVGGGAASLTAAVFACEAGKRVVVLEKGPVIGGTTARSGGVFWIPNHHLLRAQGLEDPREDALKYMCRFSFPESFDPGSETLGLEPADYRRIAAFYDHGQQMVAELQRLGALDVMAFRAGFSGAGPVDYQAELPENKTPRGRALCPRRPDGSQGGGIDLVDQLAAYLEARAVPILTDHQVERLIVEDGAVVGVRVAHGEQTQHVRARQAVIFGSGGYANNEELVRQHQQPFHFGACASPLATGDFVAMAQAVGAKIGNMSSAWRTTVVFEEAVVNRALATGTFVQPGDSMFVVNKYGRRIANEKRNYNDRTRVHQAFDPNRGEYPNLLTFYIYDRRTAEAYAGNYPLPLNGPEGRHVIAGATLDALAAAIDERLARYASETGGFSLAPEFAAELRRTFDRFNAFARDGKDADFGRGGFVYDRQWSPWFGPMRDDSGWPANELPNNTLYPLREEGPYYCIILAPGMLDSNGGPVVSERAQVLDAWDRPIRGLYGAGNCIASPSRTAYYGAGGTLGLAMTYGYLAAGNAVLETAADPGPRLQRDA